VHWAKQSAARSVIRFMTPSRHESFRLATAYVLWMAALCGCKSTTTVAGGTALPSESASAPTENVSTPKGAAEPAKKQADDDLASRCPAASKEVQATCREITYKDLPAGAKVLLRQLKCNAGPGSNYDYGSAVDLNGDGIPEYLFCCHEAPHGPCDAVLIGRIKGEWKNLTDKDGLSGFEGPCNLFVVLETQHNGFHDICLPNECAPSSKTGKCDPKIWRFNGTQYQVADSAASSPNN
jgi:hypothetical protein